MTVVWEQEERNSPPVYLGWACFHLSGRRVIGGMSSSFRSVVLCSLSLLVPLPTAANHPPEEPRDLAIIGGLLIDGNGGTPVKNSVVLLKGNRIVKVGPRSRVRIPPGTEVIDASGRTVLPGLINSNCHLTLNPLATNPASSLQRLPRAEKNLARSLQTLLMQGVTSVRNTSGFGPLLWALKPAIDREEIPAPRLFLGAASLVSSANYDSRRRKLGPEFESILQQRFRPVHTVPGDLKPLEGPQVNFWKIILTGDDWGSHNLMPNELLRAIVEEGHRAGKVVDAHVHSIMGIRSGLDAGLDVMEHPNLSEPLPRVLVEEYAAKGVFLIPLHTAIEAYIEILENPAVLNDPIYRHFLSTQEYDQLQELKERLLKARERPDRRPDGIPSPIRSVMSLDEWRTALQFTGENLRKFIQARARIAMGTGCGGTPFNFVEKAWHVRELQTYVRFGMTPLGALQTATKNGAELLKVEEELGTIEPGKLADIIIVEGNPLVDMDALRHVEVVIKNGVRYK